MRNRDLAGEALMTHVYRSKMNSALVEFEDGTQHVVSRFAVRKVPAEGPPEGPRPELPTLGSLRGMAPDCTGGMDSVAYVRKIRDEEWD